MRFWQLVDVLADSVSDSVLADLEVRFLTCKNEDLYAHLPRRLKGSNEVMLIQLFAQSLAYGKHSQREYYYSNSFQ